MKLICLDTQLVQWGVLKRASSPNYDYLIPRAQDFLDWLGNQKVEVMLPSIVVGELLAPLDATERIKALNDITEKWIIAPYDLPASLQFAIMRGVAENKQLMRELRKDQRTTRSVLIADLMIVATAVAYKADKIYTWDQDILEFANGYIEAENFLSVEVPQRLIRDGDND